MEGQRAGRVLSFAGGQKTRSALCDRRSLRRSGRRRSLEARAADRGPALAGQLRPPRRRGAGPENTLEAFRLAVDAGAGGLELDVHLTREGEVVVIHDATVDRVTDGSGAVAGMTLEEVRRLDAGDSFSPDGGQTFPYRGRGQDTHARRGL